MTSHTAAAQRLLDDLDTDLARSSDKCGRKLSWTTAEKETLRMIAATIDRRVDVAARYTATGTADTKLAVKLSAELRMLNATVARRSRRWRPICHSRCHCGSEKAQQAARARWDRDRGAAS